MKAFFAWLLLGVSAFASDSPVLSLELNDNGESYKRGSAVVIDLEDPTLEDGLVVLTAAHVVVQDISYDPKVGYVYKFYPNNIGFEVYIDSTWEPAALRNVSKEGDLALLTVKTTRKTTKIKLAKKHPDVLRPVVVSGYAMGLDFTQFPAVAITDGSGGSATIYSPEFHVVPGQSGGAVTDGEGRLVGIISSYTGNEPWVVNYTPISEISRFTVVGWDKKIVAGKLPANAHRPNRANPRIARKAAEQMNFKAPSMP